MELLSSRWHLFLSMLRTRCYLPGTTSTSLRVLVKFSSSPFMVKISRITAPCFAHLIITYSFILLYLSYWKGICPHSNPIIPGCLPPDLTLASQMFWRGIWDIPLRLLLLIASQTNKQTNKRTH